MQKAPTFFLTATGASRLVGGPPGPAGPLLLLFHGYAGSQTAHDLNTAMRKLYPEIEQLQIASIVDLHTIPRFMRTITAPALSEAYRKSALAVPPGLDPRDYVLIAPDWEGTVTASFGMSERTHDLGLVLISTPWMVFDRYTGNDPQGVAFHMVDEWLRSQSNPVTGLPAAS